MDYMESTAKDGTVPFVEETSMLIYRHHNKTDPITDRKAVLEFALAHPELPRLWDPEQNIPLGGGWKFKCFQHYSSPLWVELYDPDGIVWQTWICQDSSGSAWDTHGHEWGHNEYGDDYLFQVEKNSRFSVAEAETALASLCHNYHK